MNSASTLLQQLRIDRDADPQPHPGRPARWLATACILFAVAGVVIGWFVARPAAVPEPSRARAHDVATSSTLAPAATSRAATATLDTSGYVVARRQATVSSKMTGRVMEVLIEEGQRVEQGQVIARLDSAGTSASLAEANARLAQARANMDAARIAAEDAAPMFRRTEKQHAAALISSQAFDAAKATYHATEADLVVRSRAVDVARAGLLVAQRDHEDTVIRAPFAGIVTVKAAQPGEIVSPLSASSGFARTGIGTIVDMDSMEVEVDVSENFISRVHAGQPAIVRLNAYPGWDIAAETVAVIPAADRSKATVRVRVGFRQKDPRILPDMGVKVSFLGGDAT